MYKFIYKQANKTMVGYTNDKIFADFMNKRLTIWERIILLFTI